jgi:hypothetical protein
MAMHLWDTSYVSSQKFVSFEACLVAPTESKKFAIMTLDGKVVVLYITATTIKLVLKVLLI